MKRISYRDAPFEVKRLAHTVKPGAYFWTKDYGVDHWKDGKIYFIKVSPPDDDWTEIIEPISVWREHRSSEDGGIYNEDEDEAGIIWPWVS